jgi:DNA-binding MarR family transcriptional regulator
MFKRKRGPGAAFLIAQVGAHAASRFAERLAPFGLTPAHAGVLWNLNTQSDMTQRELADRLGAFPSRLVGLLDELEKKGLLRRHKSPDDRRSHALRITAKGKTQLEEIGEISRQHEDNLFASLGDAERELLRELLVKVAKDQDLGPRVHPGYAKLGRQ